MSRLDAIAENAEKIREISEMFTVKGEEFIEMLDKEVEDGKVTPEEADLRTKKMIAIQKEVVEIEKFANNIENIRRMQAIYRTMLVKAEARLKEMRVEKFLEDRKMQQEMEMKAKKASEQAKKKQMKMESKNESEKAPHKMQMDFDTIGFSQVQSQNVIFESRPTHHRRRSRSIGAAVKKVVKSVKRRLSTGRDKLSHCE